MRRACLYLYHSLAIGYRGHICLAVFVRSDNAYLALFGCEGEAVLTRRNTGDTRVNIPEPAPAVKRGIHRRPVTHNRRSV